MLYEEGRDGILKNNKEAVKWYRKSAESKLPIAMLRLAKMYAYGKGVPEDYIQAYKWSSLAATEGAGGARVHLAELKRQMTRDQIAEGQRLAAKWFEAQ